MTQIVHFIDVNMTIVLSFSCPLNTATGYSPPRLLWGCKNSLFWSSTIFLSTRKAFSKLKLFFWSLEKPFLSPNYFFGPRKGFSSIFISSLRAIYMPKLNLSMFPYTMLSTPKPMMPSVQSANAKRV